MKKNILNILFVFLANLIFCDESPLTTATYNKYSNNKLYYLHIDYENDITCCYETKKKDSAPIWKIPGWYSNIYVSDDGIYCIFFVNGMENLLDKNFDKNDTLFKIFKNGKEYDSKKICDVIKNDRNLERTISHYYWGGFYDIYENGLILNTVEGIKIYNFNEKNFLSLVDKRIYVKWTNEEILNSSLSIISSENIIEQYSGFIIFDTKNYVSALLGKIVEKEYKSKDKSIITIKESSVSPVELFWNIDNDGILNICSNESFKKDNTKIAKIYINKNGNVLYAVKDNKFVQYKYKK